MPPSPRVYDAWIFGVGQGTEAGRPLNPQSVALPSKQSCLRLDYGQLWQEPAIPGLDWLFTPIPKLEKHLSVALLQASTNCYIRFTLLRYSSTGFGSYTSDLWHLSHHAPRKLRAIGFPLDAPLRVILATDVHSLARYSKRTTHTSKGARPSMVTRFQRLFTPC